MINRKCRDDPSHRVRMGGSRRGYTNHLSSLIKSRPYELHVINDCGPPAARELRVNHKKSWSFNLQLNLKIAHFRVRLHSANQWPNHQWLIFRPKFSKTVWTQLMWCRNRVWNWNYIKLVTVTVNKRALDVFIYSDRCEIQVTVEPFTLA